MFDANMAVGISTWLGATTTTTSGETVVASGSTQDPVLSGINVIQTTLIDMQTKLDTLVGTTTTTPTVTPTPVVNTTLSTGN